MPVIKAHDEDSYRKALDQAFTDGGPVIVEAFVDPAEYGGLVLKGDR